MTPRSIAQVLAPTAVAIAAWFAVGWLPSQSASAQDAEAEAQAEFALLAAELADARALGAELDALEADIEAAEKAVPAQREVGTFVRFAHSAATESGVVLDQIAPLAVSSDTDPDSEAPLPSGTSSILISIGATGSYLDLMSFIDALVAADRLVLVDGVEMRADESDSAIVILDVEVRIFTTESLVGVPDLGFDDEFLDDPVDDPVDEPIEGEA
ncbi:MAG: type 4a pilus biogenesis protein PilO [Acidimicrobiales bacterium]|nr:type 4a pilus biogenesis protein PilO [Acidimicrobiales bacterium]